jgi:rhomboid protease GluP
LIMIINVVMFGLSVFIDFNSRGFSASPFHFLSPSNLSLAVLGATGTRAVLGLHQWWTLVSASFLHGSLLHLVFNMIALYQIGPLVTREFGRNRMVIIYLLSGVLGFLVSVFAGVWSTIGASAAVCGLIGAMLFYGKHRGGTYGQAVFSQIGGWAIGLAVFGFVVPGINNWGHGGGMIAGFVLAMVLGYKERSPETFSHAVIANISLVLTGLILFWSCLRGMVLLLS